MRADGWLSGSGRASRDRERVVDGIERIDEKTAMDELVKASYSDR